MIPENDSRHAQGPFAVDWQVNVVNGVEETQGAWNQALSIREFSSPLMTPMALT